MKTCKLSGDGTDVDFILLYLLFLGFSFSQVPKTVHLKQLVLDLHFYTWLDSIYPSVFVLQLSPKPSLTADGQVSSPTSVNSSTQPSSLLTPGDGLPPSLEDIKIEVKKQEEKEEEEDQDAHSQKECKGQPEVKTEEKPEASLPQVTW